MALNQNLKHSKILLFIVLLGFFSGTLPSLNYPKNEVPKKKVDDDSSKVVLFLDTTVLGPFFFPINGKVISPYGKRGKRMHTGTDIKLAHGDTVRAAFSGIVTKSTTYFGYGLLVVLQHPNNLETYYAHLSKILVNDGDSIKYGTPIGLGGRTGRATTDHLHFEIRKKGNALNSEHFFNFNDQNVKSWVWTSNKKLSSEEVEEKEEKEAPIAEIIPSETSEKSVTHKKPLITKSKKKYHVLKKGDTLFSLSRKYDTTVDAICKLNRIKKSSVLKVGRKIRVN